MGYELNQLKENTTNVILRERHVIDLYGTFESLVKKNPNSAVAIFRDEKLGNFIVRMRLDLRDLELDPLPEGTFHLTVCLKSLVKRFPDDREFFVNGLNIRKIERIQ